MPTHAQHLNESVGEPSSLHPFRPAGEPPPASSLDLGDYVRALWQHRVLSVGAAILCTLVALAASLLSPRLYEAEATLVISRPKLVASQGDTTTVANFLPFVGSRTVAAQVIKELNLDQAPYFASPSSFFSSVVTIEEVRNSTVILISGRLRDPELVARVVNRVSELGTDAARRASQREAVQARDDIKVQLDESSKRLEESESRLQKFREASQIEVLKKDVEAALMQRSDVLKLTIDIEAQKSKLARAEQELASRQKVDTFKRTIDSEPALLESARKPGASDELLALQVRNEFSNPTYEKLDEVVATTRSELSAMERRRAQMAARKLDTPHLVQLNELYSIEAQLSRLELERDLARKVYQEVAGTYETTRLMVAGRSSALQIIGAATVPDRPVSRNITRNTVTAFFAGLLLAALGVLFHTTTTSGSGREATSRAL